MEWPYPPGGAIELGPGPSWECPDRTCECTAPVAKHEDVEFSIMLTSPLGERLGGAVCRVRHGPYVLNDDLSADDTGWVTVRIDRRLTYVVLEWAPKEIPRAEGYPYRAHHWIELTHEREEAARRRLHNLGFDTRAGLREAVSAFQVRYGHYPVTGELDEIAQDLCTFHDEGRPPETKLEPVEPRGTPPPHESERPQSTPVSHPSGRSSVLDARRRCLRARPLRQRASR